MKANLQALSEAMEPIVSHLLAVHPISASQINKLHRHLFVRSIAANMEHLDGRVNKSRISFSTGIPRGEVARILRCPDPFSEIVSMGNAVEDILNGWRSYRPKARNDSGTVIRVFGPSPSFEHLARNYARGLPVRAVLDELTRLGRVELVPDQRVMLLPPPTPKAVLQHEKALRLTSKRVSKLWLSALEGRIQHPRTNRLSSGARKNLRRK